MNTKFKIILLLSFLLIFSSSKIYTQEINKEFFLRNNLNPIYNLALLNKEINLFNHSDNFINFLKHTITNNPKLIDSILTYGTSGEQSKIICFYDETGKMSSFIIFFFYNNSW